MRWNYELYILVSLQLFLRHLKLAQQVILVHENCLPEHAMEALRETEAKIRSCHCLKIARARKAVA